jgi:hypothetical protein
MNYIRILKGDIKLGEEQRKLLFDMMLMYRAFHPQDEELIERISATGFYTKDEKERLNDIRLQYILMEKAYKSISI